MDAQLAPVRAVKAADFDTDGHADVLLAGNFFGVKPTEGRYDASYGLLLRGDGQGGLHPLAFSQDNLILTGEVRNLALVYYVGGHRLLLATTTGFRSSA